MHALIIGILRLEGDPAWNSNPPKVPSLQSVIKIKNIISERINAIDPEELEETMAQIDSIIESSVSFSKMEGLFFVLCFRPVPLLRLPRIR